MTLCSETRAKLLINIRQHLHLDCACSYSAQMVNNNDGYNYRNKVSLSRFNNASNACAALAKKILP